MSKPFHLGNIVIPEPEKSGTTLAEAPVGLFLARGVLGFKSEYSTPRGRVEAFVLESGEYFHGETETAEEQRRIRVSPCEYESRAPVETPAEEMSRRNYRARKSQGTYEIGGETYTLYLDRLDPDHHSGQSWAVGLSRGATVLYENRHLDRAYCTGRYKVVRSILESLEKSAELSPNHMSPDLTPAIINLA